MSKTKAKRRRSSVPPVGYPGRLPHVGKLPIPWITRRAPERSLTRWNDVTMQIMHGSDGKPRLVMDTPSLLRDRMGWLWSDDRDLVSLHGGSIEAAGPPQWSQINCHRQRMAMDEQRCQVCSRLGAKLWVVPADWADPERQDESIITPHPPVCDRCCDLALNLCPALGRTPQAVIAAGRVLPYGVEGDVYDSEGTIVYQGIIKPTDEGATHCIARQRVAHLSGWKVVR